MGETLVEFNNKALSILDNCSDYDFEDKHESYCNKVDEDDHMDINLMNVAEKVNQIVQIIHRWNNYLYNERVILAKLKRRKERFSEHIYKCMKKGDDPRYKQLTERNLSIKIKEQPVMIKCNELIEMQEILTDFIENHFNILRYNFKDKCKMIIELIKEEELD